MLTVFLEFHGFRPFLLRCYMVNIGCPKLYAITHVILKKFGVPGLLCKLKENEQFLPKLTIYIYNQWIVFGFHDTTHHSTHCIKNEYFDHEKKREKTYFIS